MSDAVFAALADPTRRAVVESLRGGRRSVQQIADGLPVSRPAVSQHLKVLADADLVRVEQEGTRRFYSLEPRGLAEARAWMDEVWDVALARFAVLAENTDPSPRS
ncbi:MAG TPA: metalloregulator ArsR/SmtB family transcription factor [Iamia sp.]